jgi:hypothetical protein
MKKIILLFCFYVDATISFAQKDTLDITSYTAPSNNWKKETKSTVTSYTITNKTTGSWCQIGIYKSTGSKGSIAADFENEWQQLIVTPYKVTDTPQVVEVPEVDGWKIKNGGAKFTFNNQNAIAMLTTISGYGRAASIVASTNSQDYLPEVQKLIGSIELIKPTTKLAENTIGDPVNNTNPSQNSNPGSFAFSTTNFDDGWIANQKEDWVEVMKGNIKVLVHYPNKKADEYNSVLMDGLKNAWNVLVAPRYNSATNFDFKPIQSWQSIEFAEADLIENATGKKVHVVFFKKNMSGGEGKYIEFITATKNIFEQEFGVYEKDEVSPKWDKMAKMANYNKFAVAASDFTGTWTTNFTGIQQYVNAYTGYSAGMSSYSSAQTFEFNAGSTYKWTISTASGMVGNLKFNGTKSNGKFLIANNWQVKFSDMEGKPKTYDAYFSCIKGARVLWLSDTSYPGYTAYGKSK